MGETCAMYGRIGGRIGWEKKGTRGGGRRGGDAVFNHSVKFTF